MHKFKSCSGLFCRDRTACLLYKKYRKNGFEFIKGDKINGKERRDAYSECEHFTTGNKK